jgi:hypothetical protein
MLSRFGFKSDSLKLCSLILHSLVAWFLVDALYALGV